MSRLEPRDRPEHSRQDTSELQRLEAERAWEAAEQRQQADGDATAPTDGETPSAWHPTERAQWDDEQVNAAAEGLRGMPELQPDEWAQLDPGTRQAALRQATQLVGERCGWGAPPVRFERLETEPGYIRRGEYDPEDFWIRMNEDLLQDDSPQLAVETVCHEYRHSLISDQLSAETKGMRFFDIPPGELAELRASNAAYVPPEQTFENYRQQAVERDARAFARRVVGRVYGEARES